MIDLGLFSSFFVANWKLNGSYEFIDNFIGSLKIKNTTENCITLCCPYIYLDYLRSKRKNFYIGAQDCSSFDNGAYTGEVSAKMLSELGVHFCIVGHSERRQILKESNQVIKEKANKLIQNDIISIICIGETIEQKNNNETHYILKKQIEESVPEDSNEFNTIIAYEPIWAIGSGLTPNIDEIENSHRYIKNLSKKLLNFKILYGGSVNSINSRQICNINSVDGALIGGASLKIEAFNQIIS